MLSDHHMLRYGYKTEKTDRDTIKQEQRTKYFYKKNPEIDNNNSNETITR